MVCNRKAKVAIIICSYNPEEQVFSRVLGAVSAQEEIDTTEIELVVVDNNSDPPLPDRSYIKTFLEANPWVKCIRETKQGLSYARLAGIYATTAPVVIFVDDDNELSLNYIRSAIEHIEKYPCVGVWGPGNISVEFIGAVSDRFQDEFEKFFQRRNCQFLEYGSIPAKWMDFYPAGSGLISRRDVLESYSSLLNSGKLSSTGRKSDSLASGEDLQIVWQAVNMGLAAGVTPKLSLNHLVPSKRTNLRYIKRLAFGTSSAFFPALIESFPSQKEDIGKVIPSDVVLLGIIFKKFIIHLIKWNLKFLPIDLAEYMGWIAGALKALRKDNAGNKWIYKFISFMQFE